MAQRKILVTGGAGFIGSHTVEALLATGKTVSVLDNLSTGDLNRLPLTHPRLEYIQGDVLDYAMLRSMMTHCEAVLHLAAIASATQTLADPITSMQINTQGFVHVLEAARNAASTQFNSIRIVYASSAAVYGDQNTPYCSDEEPLATTSTAIPTSPYAAQKQHAESYAALYEKCYGIQSLGLRYFNVYGTRQSPHSPYAGVISRFMHAYQTQSACTIFGDGKQSRDFIHVSDIVRANQVALDSHHTGIMNIATGCANTLLDLIHCLEHAGGRPAPLTFAPARASDIVHSCGSIKKAENALNFRYNVSLNEGIRALYHHL